MRTAWDSIPISDGDNLFSIVFFKDSFRTASNIAYLPITRASGTFVFRIHTNNFIQLSGDISAGYPPLGQAGLQSHPIGSYQTLAPYLNNTSISSLLISNVNSIPQMNIPVQNLPILQQSNLAKPQIQPLVPGAAGADKARSSLLESFRSNQVSVLGLGDLAGHVLEFAQDQHGSRFIQQKLETAAKEEKTQIFDEISPSALALMTDVFGNYVIQKFVEFGTEEQQRTVLMTVLPNVETLTVQMYGCRVIQKLLDILPLEQKKIIFRVIIKLGIF